MLSRVLFTVAVAASSAMAVALPRESLPQEIVPQSVVASDEVESNPWTLVSPDGTCGGTTKFTCAGSRFGDCCNTYGFW